MQRAAACMRSSAGRGAPTYALRVGCRCRLLKTHRGRARRASSATPRMRKAHDRSHVCSCELCAHAGAACAHGSTRAPLVLVLRDRVWPSSRARAESTQQTPPAGPALTAHRHTHAAHAASLLLFSDGLSCRTRGCEAAALPAHSPTRALNYSHAHEARASTRTHSH